MKLFRSSLYGIVTGLVGMVFAPLALHAQQTIVATSGQVGVAYSYQVTSDATAPFQYDATGLPDGLAINQATGLITGTPTTAGTVVGDVSVTSNGETNSASISITIAAPASTSVISSATTASGTVGAAFTYNTAATNSPTSFNVAGLPGGLTADPTTGVISGTPTLAGVSSISLSANNAGGTGATATLALTVAAPASAPVITSATSASVAAGAAFNYLITATNTPTSFAASGLPGGFTIDTATGAITGMSNVTGVYVVGLSASNAGGTSATVNLTVTVGALSAITSANTSVGAVGVAYTYTATASPAATSFNITGLPAGLTANTTTGVISGTPTAVAVSAISLSANNASGTGAVSVLTLAVGNRPVITSATSASGTVGSAFTFAITASNSPTSFAATGLPGTLALNTTTGLITGTPTATGSTIVTVSATNAYGTSNTATLTITISNPAPSSTLPVITGQPQGTSAQIGGTVVLSVTGTGSPAPTYQWRKNGAAIAGATSSSLTLTNFQVGDAGSYTVDLTNSGGTARSQAAAVGIISTAKVIGAATEVGADIIHPNGNIYDQVLLTGASATITADATQITRISFIDLNDDIVQVEFSGAGTLTLTLENATGPAAPVKYNQPGVSYMKGHASLVITGANETSYLTVFSVGTVTAVNQTLFPAGTTYDGIADLGLVSIATTNGKFGGIRLANVGFFRAAGLTGVYAPGVAVQGPAYIGDITADADATGALVFGSTTDARITGGDLLQLNSRAIQVDGITTLTFTAGTKSSGTVLPVQTNRGRLERSGVDVTTQIIRP